MKTLKLYTTVILQAIVLFIGLVIVTNLLAVESNPQTIAFTTLNIVDQESENDIENWMLELDSWKVNPKANNDQAQSESFAPSIEEEIALEDWMLDSQHKYWTINEISETFDDDEIVLEDWMTDATAFLN